MSGARRRREQGFAAIELSAGVALLILPVALLMASLPGWTERQGVARAAARDAARVVTLAGWCDRGAAATAVDAVASGAGLAASALRLSLDCTPAAPLPREGSVTARVSVEMPGLAVPVIGSVTAWTWMAQHREPVDPYASRP